MSYATDLEERLQQALAEIKRLRALGPDDDWEERGAAGELRAEIERLRVLNDELREESQHRLEMLQRQKAEIERLRANEDQHAGRLCKYMNRIGELETEIKRLRAESDISDGLLADAKTEVERLRRALEPKHDPSPA